MERPTRVASISTSLLGSTGAGGGERSAARHSSARPAPRRRHRPARGGGGCCASRTHRRGSRGCRPTSANHPLNHWSGRGGVGLLGQGRAAHPGGGERGRGGGAG